METLLQDFQFAVRMMRKNLGFTTAAVLCLMLGIGATTGIFTVVNAVLLQPLPYSHPEQLIRVYTEFPKFPNGGLHRFSTSGPEFLDLRRDTHSWASLDAWITGGANLAGKTQPVRYCGIPERRITGNTCRGPGCRAADIANRRCPRSAGGG